MCSSDLHSSTRDDFRWNQLEKDLRTRNKQGGTTLDEGIFWMELGDVMRFFRSLEMCHFGLTDGTRFAMAKGTWPATLQDMSQPWTRLRFTAYKFEVRQGSSAAKYSTQSGGKAIVCYTVAMEGYTAIPKPQVCFYVELYKVESPNQCLDGVFRGEPLRSTENINREASTWTFVDPGTYVLLPWLWVGKYSNGEFTPPPSHYAGKAIKIGRAHV